MSVLSPRSGIQVSSVYPSYTHIKGQSPLCVCVCVCVCVCGQASCSQAMDSFVFEQQVHFRVDFLSVTLDHRKSAPGWG